MTADPAALAGLAVLALALFCVAGAIAAYWRAVLWLERDLRGLADRREKNE